MQNTVIARLALCVILVAASFGCGRSERMSVEGTVTLDGQPLEKGSIQFSPMPGTNGPTAGADIVAGKFIIRSAGGPFAGSFRVQISAAGVTGRKVLDPRSNTMIDEFAQVLPARYNSQSELQAEVKAGDVNRLEFALASDKGPLAPK